MKQGFRRAARGTAGIALAALTLSLAGCNFFVPETSGSGTTGGGTTGSYVYLSNNPTNSGAISAYAVASGSLTAVSGSPFTVNYSPSAMVVSRANTFLYASSVANQTIYAYTISSTGVLSNSQTVASSISAVSMDISPDGQWLFALDVGGTTFNEYKINTSTGALTLASSNLYSSASQAPLPSSIRVAPTGQFVVASLGLGGDIIYPFNTSTGALSQYNLITPPSGSGDYSAALDSNNFLYTARTTGLVSFSLTSAGVPTQLNTAATGSAPRSIVFNKGYSDVYTANLADSTVSGFALSGNAVMTALSGSPFAGSPTNSQLAVDNTGNFMLSIGYGSAGATQYTIDSSTTTTPGVLLSPVTVATGSSTLVPAVLAVTH
jgi:6-phosphogluconolactonase